MSESISTAPPLNRQVLAQLETQLENLLSRRYGEITEQQLLSLLQLKPANNFSDSQHALFQLHFVLYHLLYRLAGRWAQTETAYLEIGLARIKISPWQNDLPQIPDSKGAYYADWANYWRMTPMALSERLAQFWQFYEKRYSAYNAATTIMLSDAEALKVLQIEWPCSLVELKKAFRKQSLKYHPDRGGDKQSFIRLSLAYKKVLQRL